MFVCIDWDLLALVETLFESKYPMFSMDALIIIKLAVSEMGYLFLLDIYLLEEQMDE